MKKTAILFMMFWLISCTEKKTISPGVNTNSENQWKVIEGQFPLEISKIDFKGAKMIAVSDKVIAKFKKVIKENYKDEELTDSVSLYKKSHIKTIRLFNKNTTVFVMLLEEYPFGLTYSEVLFYDNQKKTFLDQHFTFKIHALYDHVNGKLQPTNLKTEFKINIPEITLTDFNKDGILDYQFTRLFHNGTANAIETAVISIANQKIDTLDFNQKWIGLGTEKPEKEK